MCYIYKLKYKSSLHDDQWGFILIDICNSRNLFAIKNIFVQQNNIVKKLELIKII